MPPMLWVALALAIGAVIVAYFVAGFAKAKKDNMDEQEQTPSKFESLEDVIDFDGEEQASVYESSAKKPKEDK